MKDLAELIGQTLDEKYRIERELGRGGMGTVYLATHLGTERPVAIKVIAPQYMKRPEFVERFRREARAAGRLRHPNVVDVTDFGFAVADGGQVAYLVMEYLDGCTLGEILEEERNLPVGWTLDILEQVCSAVQEAHEQGIIHRDLKPDNIWLEPNQRGGYTVKVLDFGIAKLETNPDQILTGDSAEIDISVAPNTRLTSVSNLREGTLHDSSSPTLISETGTMAGGSDAGTAMIQVRPEPQANGSEKATAIIPTGDDTDQDSVGTKLLTTDGSELPPTPYTIRSTGFDELSESDLTRVGAVLGTPLYMSPEQCHGEKLDPRSDVYSLGVIAYQMLSGDTPFRGDFTKVMADHKTMPPPPFKSKKVRRKLKRAIYSALEKDPDKRPQSAEAFAAILRSRSEGIFGLLRRAGMIWTEHMAKFLALSTLFYVPTMIFTALLVILNFLRVRNTLSSDFANVLIAFDTLLLTVVSGFCAYLIIGTITWIVTQNMAVPLRPISIRMSLRAARDKWKTFAGTGMVSTILTFVIGILTCGIGFLVTNVAWMLLAPVVMMEGLKGRQALRRSTDLVRRSVMTSFGAFLIMFLIPTLLAGFLSFFVNTTAKAFGSQHSELKKIEQVIDDPQSGETADKSDDGLKISVGTNRTIDFSDNGPDMGTRLRDTVLESLLQLFLLPLQIISTSFTAIIVALLYLKTRQAGGESLQDLMGHFDNLETPSKKWQERVRQRLIESGRMTSKPTG